ncbi:hypothetical protein [Spirochaeta isovalerica]|uniref:Tetratricopeptide repeat protein n=1 Tax=Spirochaeta isovalerica TaxID=150 RepID=A0A841R8X5_9SPIO|nr:hypothetical protein [Spirochaeta isovalerica]MBB6480246.1 hypothetical protein [Spirochaeta isovalerica]
MKVQFLITALVLLLSPLFSQEMKLYAPFPSRLEAVTSGSDIVLTWKDAVDVDEGTYEIFRADRALTADNLYLAEKIGTVPGGTQTFKDKPPSGAQVYYAVFVNDSTQVYKICIPYRNVTISPVSIEESDIEETRSTVISNLTAQIFDSDVAISYDSSLEERSIILFRSTSVIDSYDKIIKSVLIGEDSGSQTSIIDNPIAGLNYYYAAIDAALYRSGSRNLLYSGNYTTDPVHIKFSHEITEDNRFVKSAMPLPLLKISSDLKSGEKLEERRNTDYDRTLEPETLNQIRRMIEREKTIPDQPEKTVLAYNKNINPIVTSYFAGGLYERCADALEPFLSSLNDRETREQSHFYRGQCFYYLGRYNEALLELIMVEKTYYRETEPFFNAIYREIKRD